MSSGYVRVQSQRMAARLMASRSPPSVCNPFAIFPHFQRSLTLPETISTRQDVAFEAGLPIHKCT